MNDLPIGANLPWIAYGDFGANAWQPAGGVQTRLDALSQALDRVAIAGIRRIRWFMLCDGRAGILFAADGSPLGLDDYFFADVDAALGAAADRDIEIMFVLLDFLWCDRARTEVGVQLGGRCDVLRDGATRAPLLDRVLTPILERYGHNPHVFAWDIINEPEWVTCGLGAARRRPCVGVDAMREFVADAAALVHRYTAHGVTVGSASTAWVRTWRGLGLDFYQTHWYRKLESRSPLATPVSELGLDRPVVLGEFPSRVPPAELQRILDTARVAGYSAAFLWSVLADDAETDFAVAEVGLGLKP
jgi:hypothetical protein